MKRGIRIACSVLAALAAVVVVGALALVLSLQCIAHWPFNWPSDSSARRSYEAYKGDFHRLVEMSREDRLRGYIPTSGARLDPRWGRPDQPNSYVKGMPLARFEEYAKLFRKLGLRYGIMIGQDEQVSFDIACVGLLAIGSCSYKGIVYKPPARMLQVVSGLADVELPHAAHGPEPGYYVVPLDESWYIYRYETD